MKRIFSLFAVTLLLSITSSGQTIEGRVTGFMINAKSLQNNGGENPNRKVSVYLPPGYEKDNKRFPVIYYMHGFSGNDTITAAMKSILDQAIARHKIRPFILVIADQKTIYDGSFYSNSSLTGNWSDFEAKELVDLY